VNIFFIDLVKAAGLPAAFFMPPGKQQKKLKHS
jgi:hypothetical protein